MQVTYMLCKKELWRLGGLHFKTEGETQLQAFSSERKQAKITLGKKKTKPPHFIFRYMPTLSTHQAGRKYYSLTAHEATSCLHPNPETMTTFSLQEDEYRATLERKNTYAKVIDYSQTENRINYCSWVLPHLKSRTSQYILIPTKAVFLSVSALTRH